MKREMLCAALLIGTTNCIAQSSVRLKLHLVTTYDCSRRALQTADFEDAAAQLAAANTIVLTKIDLVANERRDEALEVVASANPVAKIVNEFSAAVRARQAFLAPSENEDVVGNGDAKQQERRSLLHPRIRVFRAKFDEDFPWEASLDWLENIAGALGNDCCALKQLFQERKAMTEFSCTAWGRHSQHLAASIGTTRRRLAPLLSRGTAGAESWSPSRLRTG
ncbi:GTP-binding protein [Paraburkholderia aromaticivorans]|uniref:GTP-binding protein n=1 Tax=Paraburkholderia aromaticivorans TaxID=2026199 RepID=UPI001455F3BC|nr:GTP-binding protein [Paraburkholderia aromaticivorans]